MDSTSQTALMFGANVDPSAADPQEPFRRARLADQHGLDLITIQDHPYNVRFLETWTLLTAIAMRTERVRLGTNVLTTPLRPPAMLAKMAATLDVLSEGRVELGIGAGAYVQGIRAFGGPVGSSAERYRAFKESLEIIKGMLENAGGSFSYDGEFYQLKGARPGPVPAHPIRIWTGAIGTDMLRLTGRLAGGLLISINYVPVDRLLEVNRLLDEGAAEAGRSPGDIRRGYNLQGEITFAGSAAPVADAGSGQIVGPVEHWIEEIAMLHREYRQDTFTFWPIAGDEARQIETFAREVVPAVRSRLS